MTTLAVQYLESNPGTSPQVQQRVAGKLRQTMDLLPISLLLIGWEAAQHLIQICREEAERHGAKLYRWHPLLTGDGCFVPRREWQTIGLNGEPVPGFRGLPEFTFVCPNQPSVQEAAAAHLAEILSAGLYDGIFLDRIRFPSPAADPTAHLACFCPDCHAAAAEQGLDLTQVQDVLTGLCSSAPKVLALLSLLFSPDRPEPELVDLQLVRQFLHFRKSSINTFVARTAALIRRHDLAVGLDSFSPSLTNMVGQDLPGLNQFGDWIKPMTYGHTLGPSGLPFELGHLSQWLCDALGMEEREALHHLSRTLQQPLPESISGLRLRGVTPQFIQEEVARARCAGVDCLLAGMELVQMEGVTNLSMQQIKSNLVAYGRGGADGIVFSWDLQLMPQEWLQLVAAQLEESSWPSS